MKIFISSLLLLASGGSNSVTTAFTTPTLSSTTTNRPSETSSLSSSRYNNDYYRDYSNNNSYRNNNYNNNNNGRYDNYVMDRNAGRFDNSVGSATYGSTSIGGRRYDNNNRSYGSSYYNSNDSYYRGPYDRVGSSENFRLTSSPNSRKMRSDYYYDDYDTNNYYNNKNNYYNNNNNNYVTQRRGGYADDIGGRSRYSTPMYSNGGYASPQGLSEDFRTGREGPMMNSMTSSRQRRNRNSNRIQDYYTPGEREWMSQRQNSGLRYGWQQQYDRERGNVRMGSGEDFRRGSSLSRISDYFTPLERERRQMSDNRVLGRGGGGSYGNDGYYSQYGSRSGGVRRGGYYDDYPDYGFDSYDDEYDDYFENDGGYSSGSRQRGRNRNGNTWDNLLNMFRN